MTTPLDRLRAVLADRYRLERELGTGGMATVYLADDLKHRRQVAVKVLRAEVAAGLGSERFLREVEVAAGLSHPHILPLHDSGEADGQLYFVMPFVAGESLRHRLDRDGALPIADAIRIARAMASALGAAHRRDIVHRDVKPENILLADGEPVLADFGIARAITAAAGGRLTSTGIAVGTPIYMAPEQAAADPHLDGRTDLYALGAVLFEMLAGEAPFQGRSAEVVLARKLSESPTALRVIRPTVSPALESLIQKALARTPADRYQTAEEFIEALDRIAPMTAVGAAPAAATRWIRVLPWGLAAALGIVAVMATMPQPSAEPGGPFRLSLTTPPGTQLATNVVGAAVSPDGRTVVFSAGTRDTVRLYVRPLNEFTTRPLPGTEGALEPFFSPDGRSVGYLSTIDRRLKWVPLAGGTPRDLGTAPHYSHAMWADNDTIYWTDRTGSVIAKVAASGGPVTRVAVPTGVETAWVLPGGKRALVSSYGEVRLVDLATGQGEVVIRNARWPRWVDRGFVVYARSETDELAAVAFDLKQGRVIGEPVTVAAGVSDVSVWGTGSAWAVSTNGTLVYAPRVGPLQASRLRRVNREGQGQETLPVEAGLLRTPRFSPDGTTLTYAAWQGGDPQLWSLDLRSGQSKRVTTGRAERPMWSPDGQWLYYTGTLRPDVYPVYRQPVGGGAPEIVTRAGERFADRAYGISGDGHELIFLRFEPDSIDGPWNRRWLYGPIGGMAQVLDTADGLWTPALSPDGRWLAYGGTAVGTMEIFVRRYPNGTPVQVSANGGIQPAWSAGRQELFYRSRSEEVFAVAVTGTERPLVSRPTRIFRGDFPITNDFYSDRHWDVTPDGRQFVFALPDAVYLRNGAGMLAGAELRVVPDLVAMVRNGLEKR